MSNDSPVRRAFAVPESLAGLGVELRPETEADVAFLSRLFISTRWDEMAMAVGWSEEQKIAFLLDQFRLQRSHYTTQYSDPEFMIVEANGEAAGRLYLDHASTTDLRVVDISFLPGYRGLGYGSALLRAVQDVAAASGKIVSIHVDAFNPAKRLYGRLGFRHIGQRGPYWLMHWSSPME